MRKFFYLLWLTLLSQSHNLYAQWTEIPGAQTYPFSYMVKQNGVFLAAGGNYTYRSFDGRAWQLAQALPPVNDFNSKLKLEGNRVYLYDKSLPSSVGLYYSSNQWNTVNNIPIPQDTRDLFFSGTRIFRVDNTNVLFKTDNDGTTWEQVFSPGAVNLIQDIEHWNSELRLVSSNNIYASTDNGLNWTLLSSGSFGDDAQLFSLSGNLYCYSNVAPQVSSDGGVTWGPVSGLQSWFGDYPGDMTAWNGKLYAVNYKNLFFSDDNGQTWQGTRLDDGEALAPDGTDLLVAGGFGVLRSPDAVIWKTSFHASGAGSYDEVRNIQTFDGAVFVSTNRSRSFFTRNNGLDWQLVTPTFFAQNMFTTASSIFMPPTYKLAAGSNVPSQINSPYNGGEFYYAAGNGVLLAFDQTGQHIWKSADEGNNWTQLSATFTDQCWDIAFAGGKFFISFPGAVYVSDDDGQSWTLFTQGTSGLQNSNFDVAGNDIFLNTFFKTYRYYPAGWQLWGQDYMNFTGENGRFIGWLSFPPTISVFDDNGQVVTDIAASNQLLDPDYPMVYKDNKLYAIGQSPTTFGSWSVWTLDFSNTQTGPVSGEVFLDDNSNGIKDMGEQDLNENLVSLTPNNFVTTTDQYGIYNFMLWQNGDVLSPQLPSGWYNSTPAQIAVNQTGSNNNFAIQPNSAVVDLSINASANAVFRPGFQTAITLTISNPGTLNQGGMVDVTLPSFMTLVSANPAPSGMSGNTITWQLTPLPLLGHTSITLVVLVDPLAQLGTPAGILATVTTSSQDADQSNNQDVINDRIRGAFDPNDKTVVPEQFTPQQLTNGQTLTYKVRFQNTGTWPASFVKILDTLSNLLDVSTLRVVASSHPVSFKILQGHIVEFYFQDINLADSQSDEPGSHGFALFTIRPMGGLALGTVIPNRAGIYFDFNTPVITNTAESTVKLLSASHEALQSIFMSLSPNPVSGRLNLSWTTPAPANSRLFVTTASGANLQQFNVPAGAIQLTINTGEWAKGLYFIRLEQDGKTIGVAKVARN